MTAVTDNTTTTPRIHASSSIISFTLFLCPIVYTVTKRHRRRVQEGGRRTEREAERAFLSSIVSREQGSLRPPLPAIVRQSLSRRRLAYLGTVTSSSGGGVPCPHLSLMRFTYLPEEDSILMSTNVYTKKYDMLSAGVGGGGEREGGEGGALVALLVHDFADSSHFSSRSSSSSSSSEEANSGGGMYSITLNGTCSVVKDVLLAEKYRQIHLKNNPDYPQFIVGDNIAMLRVDVISARICNIKDEVIKWNVFDG